MTERLRKLATYGLAAAAAVMVAGCTLSRDARNSFVEEYYCPPERVTVTELPHFKQRTEEGYWNYHDLPPPPPDVQADPKRLAIYQERRRSLARYIPPKVDPLTYFEVKGCDKIAWYACRTGKHCKVY